MGIHIMSLRTKNQASIYPSPKLAMLPLAVLLALMVILPPAARAADPLKINLEKSKIGFVGHKAEGKHAGGFKKFDVQAKADFEDASKSSMRIEIATESIWSDDPKLTEHLKNPDFFDIRKYPKIVFESTKIDSSKHEEGKIEIIGKLKMLDKVEELVIPVTFEASDEGVTVQTQFKLDRTKWGMDYGKGKIEDKVDITAEFVFAR